MGVTAHVVVMPLATIVLSEFVNKLSMPIVQAASDRLTQNVTWVEMVLVPIRRPCDYWKQRRREDRKRGDEKRGHSSRRLIT